MDKSAEAEGNEGAGLGSRRGALRRVRALVEW